MATADEQNGEWFLLAQAIEHKSVVDAAHRRVILIEPTADERLSHPLD